MKVVFVCLLVLFSGFSAVYGQGNEEGYRIEIAIDGWKDSLSYLGYYIGGKTYLDDTARVDNGRIVFEGSRSLTPGMYFLYSPQSIFFEFLVSEDDFVLRTSVDSIVEDMEVSGSKENELFFDYQKKMSALQARANAITERMKGSSEADSLARLEELRSISNEVNSYQRNERQKHEGTFYSEILSLILRPENISVSSDGNNNEDDKARFDRYKSDFWHGTNFENPGTLRNPIFEQKLNEYFDKLVINIPDSVISEIERFMAEPMDSTVFRFMVVTLTNKYANSKTMGMDAVYVHMVDNYYRSGKAYWIDDTTLTRMIQNSDRFKPILIGKKAPVFVAEKLDGTNVSNPFSVTNKDFKILFFYDSGCGHCKKAAPVLMEAFSDLQKEGISADVISMNLAEDKDEWVKFIDEFQMKGEALGDLKGESNAGYYYYIDSTPQIFIVDKDNKIIAKKISAEYVDDFIRDYIDQQQ